MQRRFDEYFAKVILESCFPERFVDLQISDKPDLRSGNKVGIEVTNCMPPRVAEAFKLWDRVAKQREQTPPRILGRLEQLDEVQLVDGDLIWMQGLYSQDGLDDFYRAIEKKVDRLNSPKADYADMEAYELFINSFIMIPMWLIESAIKRIQNINSQPKQFDKIYLITNEQKLLIFDLRSASIKVLYLYSRLECMADKARQLCKGAN